MDINNLRKQYINIISGLTNKDDIINSLPDSNFNNYNELMNMIIKVLITNHNELLKSLSDEEKEELKDDLELDLFKIEYCKKELLLNDEYIKLVDKKARNLIFARSLAGNNYIKLDIKNSDEHYYYNISKAIERLKNGDTDFNESKQRFMSNNNKLKGVREVKENKVRITYIPIDHDSVLVLNAIGEVKDHNSLRKREKIINRKLKVDNQLNKLKMIFKNRENKEEIIKENYNDYLDIIDILNNKGRTGLSK